MAERRCGDGKGVERRLPGRQLGAELVFEAGGAGTAVEQDRAVRSSNEDGLPVTDRHDDGLGRSVRPHAKRRGRDERGRDDGGGEGQRALAPKDLAGADARRKRGIVREARPGRKPRDGQGRGRDSGEKIGDLFEVGEQARHGDRGEPGQLRDN